MWNHQIEKWQRSQALNIQGNMNHSQKTWKTSIITEKMQIK